MAKASDSSLSPWALAIAGGIGSAYLADLVLLTIHHQWLVDAGGRPLATDFLSFWSASLLALQGHAFYAYDWPAMHALQRSLMGHDPGGFLGWAYPPLFFVAVLPLALMPYGVAFLGWIGVTLGAYLVAIAGITRDRRAALFALAAPASLACLIVGQNGFLTAALMAGVLLNLEARPILAGLLLGLLTYKPHFGLLFPVALLVGGYGRAFVSAALASLAILATSWLLAAGSLIAFVHHLGGMSHDFLSQGHAGFYKLQSLYGLLRMWGARDDFAFAAQGLLLLMMAGFVAWLWRSRKSFPLKCAGLCAASLLATPYLFLYDFPILALAIALLWRERAFDRTETVLLLMSQFAIALVLAVNAPMGLAASALTFLVIARRLACRSVRTAPLAQPA